MKSIFEIKGKQLSKAEQSKVNGGNLGDADLTTGTNQVIISFTVCYTNRSRTNSCTIVEQACDHSDSVCLARNGQTIIRF